MTVVVQALEEVGQLLSFARYGKSKLDTLASQLQLFTKNLRKNKSRDELRKINQELHIFNVTLMTSLDTVRQWQYKVEALKSRADLEGDVPRKLRHQVQHLEKMLVGQENRISDLFKRYQQLETSAQIKSKAAKPKIMLGRQPVRVMARVSEG